MKLNLSADEVLATTRAVRKRLDFDKPVEREVIEECLQLAVQAPTGSNSQGWQWVMVTEAAKKKALADIYKKNFEQYRAMGASNTYQEGDLRFDQKDRVLSSADHLTDNFHRVPIIMVPCIAGNLDRVPAFAGASAWGSLLPAVWSFMLAARARSLGSCWTTLHLVHDEESRALLGLPDNVMQGALIPVAHLLGGTDFKPGARRDLDRVIHHDGW